MSYEQLKQLTARCKQLGVSTFGQLADYLKEVGDVSDDLKEA